MAAESARAYQGGPLELSYYRESSRILEKTGELDFSLEDMENFALPSQYNRKLDWFAVDLEEEHSAMDGQILEEHTEYVVYAIHRVYLSFQHSNIYLCVKGGFTWLTMHRASELFFCAMIHGYYY